MKNSSNVLMIAIAIDGSNKLFPIVFRVREWFLYKLRKYIGVHYDFLSIISDRIIKILVVVKEIFVKTHYSYYMAILLKSLISAYTIEKWLEFFGLAQEHLLSLILMNVCEN